MQQLTFSCDTDNGIAGVQSLAQDMQLHLTDAMSQFEQVYRDQMHIAMMQSVITERCKELCTTAKEIGNVASDALYELHSIGFIKVDIVLAVVQLLSDFGSSWLTAPLCRSLRRCYI